MKLKGLMGMVAAGCIALSSCAQYGKLQKQLDYRGRPYFSLYEKAAVITSLKTDETYVMERDAISYVRKTQMILDATKDYIADKGQIDFRDIQNPIFMFQSVVDSDRNMDNKVSTEEASGMFNRVAEAYINDVLDFNIIDFSVY